MHEIPVLPPEYLLPSQWVPVLGPTYLLPRRTAGIGVHIDFLKVLRFSFPVPVVGPSAKVSTR